VIRAFYAIRHLPSGGFLPEIHKGYTFSEPSTKECDIPRLFTTKAGAKRALTWWLRGTLHVTKTGGQWGFGEPEYDESWHDTPMPDRKTENMEVVQVLLKT